MPTEPIKPYSPILRVKLANGDSVPLVTITVRTPFIFKARMAIHDEKHQNFTVV